MKNFLPNTIFKSTLQVESKRTLLKKSLLLRNSWIQLRKNPKNALKLLTNSQNIETLSNASTKNTLLRITKQFLINLRMLRKKHAKRNFLSSHKFSFTSTKSIPEFSNVTHSVHSLLVKLPKTSRWIQQLKSAVNCKKESLRTGTR